jgi:Flp pilus assembly protein TadB
MLSLLAVLAMGLVPHSQSLIATERPGNYPRVMLAQAQVHDSPAFIAPRQRSAADLHLELEELQASRPSVGAPIAMLVTGGVVAVASFILAYAGLLVAFDGGAWLLVGSLLGLGVGIALVVVGVVLLVKAQRQRRAITRELEAVRRELRTLEYPPSEGPPAPGPFPGTWSPAPPPQVEGPHASVLLAGF